MEPKICGRAWVFGDNVDTDHIIPSRYAQTTDYREMSEHCFADLRPEFGKERRDGDILVGGRNFGCGSSRQIAPLAIKNRGISCIVAESFARIFLRNSVNMGFRVVELPEATRLIAEGDILWVKAEEGQIVNQTKDQVYKIQRLPGFMENIYAAGGLDVYIQKRLAEERKQAR
jgi:3-isopropylmalate/(R)-2-methylmalate dehydratase small subunit